MTTTPASIPTQPTSIIRTTIQFLSKCWKQAALIVLVLVLFQGILIPFTPNKPSSPTTEMCMEQKDVNACKQENIAKIMEENKESLKYINESITLLTSSPFSSPF
jgi:hypothetical protein